MLELNFNNIMFSVTYLIKIIKSTLIEMINLKLEPCKIDFTILDKTILELETIEEFHIKIIDFINDALVILKKENNEKSSILIDAIKNAVTANYTDAGLCLNQISDILKMSPGYIGRIFKENMQISLSEYINTIRLNKAAEWLSISDMDINQVMAKVGIENRSHFYTHFKKTYGVTPREYAIKKRIENK